MPLYSYKAFTASNESRQGTITAGTKDEAAGLLKKQGLQPLSIQEKKTATKTGGTLPAIEKITLCRYMATMLTAGLSLSEGIIVLKEETKHPLMRQILDDVAYHLEQGQSLSSVFSLYPQAFDPFFVTLVRAGEVSGTLAGSFKYLEEEIRAEYSLSQKISSALMYPAIVSLAMMGIGFLMFFFILPQIGKVFLNMTLPLPAFTKAMFTFAITVAQYRIPLILGTIVLAVVLVIIFQKPAGKRFIVRLIAPIPVINSLLKQVDVARFCRIFSTLMRSAVPVTNALDIALNSMSYPQFRNSAKDVIEQVSKGKTIAAAFHAHKLFPPLLTQMIAAGEKSGTLDQTLGDLGQFYEGEVTESVKKSTELLEPALMLLVGIGVGGMILSIIAPLYSVIGSLQATTH